MCMLKNDIRKKKEMDGYDIHYFDRSIQKSFIAQVDECLTKEQFSSGHCLKLCQSKKLSEFSMPLNIVTAYRNAFKILFEAFT